MLRSGRKYSLASIKSLLSKHQLIKLIKQTETKGVRDVRPFVNEWLSPLDSTRLANLRNHLRERLLIILCFLAAFQDLFSNCRVHMRMRSL